MKNIYLSSSYWRKPLSSCAGMTMMLLLAARAHAEIPRASVFFTPQEAHEAETRAEKNTPGQGDIRLGAVMFYSPNDWTLWLQGEKWTPETTRDDLRVLDVTASEVRLSWRDEKDATEREITLRPNQSYQIATGKIIASP